MGWGSHDLDLQCHHPTPSWALPEGLNQRAPGIPEAERDRSSAPWALLCFEGRSCSRVRRGERDPANLSQKAALHFQGCLLCRLACLFTHSQWVARPGASYPNLTPAWAGTDRGKLASWEGPLPEGVPVAGEDGLDPECFHSQTISPTPTLGPQNWLFTYANERPSLQTDFNTCLVNESHESEAGGTYWLA